MKVLVIPDVHGRIFWKEDVNKLIDYINHQVIDVVFLGDYLDPYDFEKITVRDAISNFKEIIEFTKKRANVHLLLGNHDMHYFNKSYSDNIYKVRYSYAHAREIKKIFRENKEMFSVAWETRVNDKRMLFTHAGVLKAWAEIHMGKLRVRHGYISDEYKIRSIKPTAESLNKLLKSTKGIFSLGDIPEERGGWWAYGSPIWADFREHLESLEWPPAGREELCNYTDEVYQVFGHSLAYPFHTYDSLDMCYIGPHFAMLDARTSFLVEDDGSIREIDDNLVNFGKSEEIYKRKDDRSRVNIRREETSD